MDKAQLEKLGPIVVAAWEIIDPDDTEASGSASDDSDDVMGALVELWKTLSDECIKKVETELDSLDADTMFKSVEDLYLYLESKGCYEPNVANNSRSLETPAGNLPSVQIEDSLYLVLVGKGFVVSTDAAGTEAVKSMPVFERDSIAIRRLLRDMNTDIKQQVCVGRLLSVAAEYNGIWEMLNSPDRSVELTSIYEGVCLVDSGFRLGPESPLLNLRTVDARMWVSKVATLNIVHDTDPEAPFGSDEYILGQIVLGIDYVGFKDNRTKSSSLLFFPYWESELGAHTTVSKCEYLETMWANLAMFMLYKHHIRAYPDNFCSEADEETSLPITSLPRIDRRGGSYGLASGSEHFINMIEEITRKLCESRWSDK